MRELKKYLAAALVSAALAIPAFTAGAENMAASVVMGTAQTKVNDEAVMSLLWMQTSAEYKALCHQAYNDLRRSVRRAVHKPHDKPLAVVLDIDETVLDNTPFKARTVGTSIGKARGAFSEWVAMEKAEPLPGSVGTLKWIDRNGVEIFYVSDRSLAKDKESTLANLKKYGIPVKEGNLILHDGKGTKSQKFDELEKKYTVVAYVGDNLYDFPFHAEGLDPEARAAVEKKMGRRFGTKYILLPNPDYGSWEYALSENYKALPPEGVLKVRKNALRKQPLETDKGK